jgi:catechol 2,3-dioxygenase-like lactoylglutathione lyase family enzyme
MVRGVDNIGVCSTDLQRSTAFYEKLGFHEAYRNERGVLLTAGSANLFLFATRQADPPPVGRELGLFANAPGLDHISFSVLDVDDAYAKLSATGIEFDGVPENQSWGARMVGLKDPDGNNLYLLQRGWGGS